MRDKYSEPEAWDFIFETVKDSVRMHSYHVSDVCAEEIADKVMDKYDGVIANGWA